MTLPELIALARARLDDNAQQADGSPAPNLWSDLELTGFLNEAVREACERARLIRDEVTDEVTLIPIVLNQSAYPLHESVFEIDSVRYEDTGMGVAPTSDYELRQGTWCSCNGYGTAQGYGAVPGYGAYMWWRTVHVSRARHYIQETLPTEYLQLRTVGLPTEVEHVSPDDPNTMVPTELRLVVYRYPLVVMVLGADPVSVPEIHSRHHERLIDWVCYRAFARRDRDTYDPSKSSDAENAFIASFGIRNNADQQRKLRERRRETTRYHELG